VLEFITQEQSVTRARVFERFRQDEEEAVASVVHDLASSGLVFATGQGRATLYRAATEAERALLVDEADLDSLVAMVWVNVFRNPGTNQEQLARSLNVDAALISRALEV
jgi:hypothetical protein